jgi:MFS superfamily sulfate permease-like transporter
MSVRGTEPELGKYRWPILQGILPLDKSGYAADITAGITLAALGIPEVMGYTKIIGTPVVTGLYTLLLPVLAFAIFGSSRHLVVSADSATAAMVSAALISLSFVPNSPKYIALTSLVGLVAAGMLLVARVLRAGFLADFLSRTVLVGFLSGVGIQVAFGELHGMLGLEKGDHGFLRQIFFIVQHLPETHLTSLLISLGALGVIVGFEIYAPRFPGALLAVIGMIVASASFHWGNHNIQLVGEVPRGLPGLGPPNVSWADVPLVLPIAFSCFIVILAQSAATSRAYALRYRDPFSQNADLVGLCLANAAAGCSSTFIVNGSPTKTAMVDTAGGRSQIAHLTTAAMVALVLLFLTKPLSYLPNAVLAAIVFLIGVKLVDYRGLAEIRRKSPREFRLALATATTVVFVGVEEGIVLALVLSLLRLVRHSYKPHTAVVLHDAAEHSRMEPVAVGKMIEPGLVMYWFGADLFYANASHFAEQVLRLVTQSPFPVHWLVVDAGAITGIDYSAGRTLKDLQQDLVKQDVVLALARVSDSLRQDLDRHELTQIIGVKRLFESRRDALDAYHLDGPKGMNDRPSL